MNPGADQQAPRHSATSGEIATLVEGSLHGPGDITVTGLMPLDTAGPTDLTFIRDEAHAARWASSRAGVALVTQGLKPERAGDDPRAVIFVADADLAMITLLKAVADQRDADEPTVHPTASVDPSATIGSGVAIGAFAVVGAGAVIGDNVRIGAAAIVARTAQLGAHTVVHANVVIQPGVRVGERCIIHPGVVLGADGFGYRQKPDGSGVIKIPHIGGVLVGNEVEIGANAAIDRAVFGDTLIGDGTKIDNLVQIGHNCEIGRSVIICGACAIGGSTRIGDGAVLGGKCGVPDNVTIEAGAKLAGGSLVSGHIKAGEPYAGVPARPASQVKHDFANTRRIDRLRESIATLTARLDAISEAGQKQST